MCIRDRWTGIPAGRLLEGETQKLLRMEDELGKRVVGQTEACLLYTSPSPQTVLDLVCRLLLEHKNTTRTTQWYDEQYVTTSTSSSHMTLDIASEHEQLYPHSRYS